MRKEKLLELRKLDTLRRQSEDLHREGVVALAEAVLDGKRTPSEGEQALAVTLAALCRGLRLSSLEEQDRARVRSAVEKLVSRLDHFVDPQGQATASDGSWVLGDVDALKCAKVLLALCATPWAVRRPLALFAHYRILVELCGREHRPAESMFVLNECAHAGMTLRDCLIHSAAMLRQFERHRQSLRELQESAAPGPWKEVEKERRMQSFLCTLRSYRATVPLDLPMLDGSAQPGTSEELLRACEEALEAASAELASSAEKCCAQLVGRERALRPRERPVHEEAMRSLEAIRAVLNPPRRGDWEAFANQLVELASRLSRRLEEAQRRGEAVLNEQLSLANLGDQYSCDAGEIVFAAACVGHTGQNWRGSRIRAGMEIVQRTIGERGQIHSRRAIDVDPAKGRVREIISAQAIRAFCEVQRGAAPPAG
jgi:hypothetical protein